MVLEVSEDEEAEELDLMPNGDLHCLLGLLFVNGPNDLVNPIGGGMSCGGEECGEGKVSVTGEPVDTKPESSPEEDSLIEAEKRFDWG